MPATKWRTSIIVVDGKPDLVRSCELAIDSWFVSPFFTCSFGRCNTPAEKSHLFVEHHECHLEKRCEVTLTRISLSSSPTLPNLYDRLSVRTGSNATEETNDEWP